MNKKHGFSLIELLVTIGIIGILVSISAFALVNVRQQGRDSKRKADLETIRSALELYKSDCGSYPAALPTTGSPLKGTGPCAANTYIQTFPGDPDSARYYAYARGATNTTYELCTSLEQGSTSVIITCGGSVSCGTVSSAHCNFQVTNP